MKQLFTISIAAVFLNACQFDFKIIRGNGDITVREIEVQDFTDIDINGNYKVELYRSDNPRVIIETDENLVDYLDIETWNNRLEIKNRYTLKPSHQLLIEIYYDELSSIKSSGASSIAHAGILSSDELDVNLSGAGSIKLNLDVDDLYLNLSGAGILETKGQVNRQVVKLSGAGNLDAGDLESQNCEITISGVGNAKINTVKELHATITGLGNIEYYGDPEKVTQNISGLGNIKSKER